MLLTHRDTFYKILLFINVHFSLNIREAVHDWTKKKFKINDWITTFL